MSVPTGNANAANAPAATTAAAMSSNGQNEEIFDMDLSSDDEAAARVSRSVCCQLHKRFILSERAPSDIILSLILYIFFYYDSGHPR